VVRLGLVLSILLRLRRRGSHTITSFEHTALWSHVNLKSSRSHQAPFRISPIPKTPGPCFG